MDLENIIKECRYIKNQYNLTNDEVYDLIQKNHQYVSKRTIQRFFSNNGKKYSFRYNSTIKPIFNALYDLDKGIEKVPIADLINEKDEEITFLKQENSYLKNLINFLLKFDFNNKEV